MEGDATVEEPKTINDDTNDTTPGEEVKTTDINQDLPIESRDVKPSLGDDLATSKAEPTEDKKAKNDVHDSDRKTNDSRRVEEGRRWNNRDRQQQQQQPRARGKHNRFDPASQEKSSDPVEIRKQVDFYFSDSNLLTDKFLFNKIEGCKNLPVPIDVIHSFKRMTRYQPRSAVVDALKDSTIVNIVDNDSAIQRKQPLPEDLEGKAIEEVSKAHETSSMARSIYVKGFGDEESTTQFTIEAFFANFGPTNSVRLRRRDDGKFKGSVFVEFDTEATQKSFLSLDPKPTWKSQGLIIQGKKEYLDQKAEDIKAGRLQPRESDSNKRKSYDNKKHDRGDGEDSRDWRQRRDEDRDKQRSGRGGRGGRGRGRGGRGNHRGDRDRDRDRRSDRREDESIEKTSATASVNDTKAPDAEVADTAPVTDTIIDTAKLADTEMADAAPLAEKKSTDEAISGQKRSREEDGEADVQGKDKKVDTKDGDN